MQKVNIDEKDTFLHNIIVLLKLNAVFEIENYYIYNHPEGEHFPAEMVKLPNTGEINENDKIEISIDSKFYQ